MEYLIGAAITMVVYIISNKIANKPSKQDEVLRVTYSQSHIYELLRPYIEMVGPLDDPRDTQSTKYLKNIYMKIMVVDNKAYWIKDNVFYVADVVDGEIVRENAKEVDTMAMSKVELDEMIFIVEKLREDNNDSRGSGK